MTIIVGVLCQDGVVIGADGSATFAIGQLRTIEQPTRKIKVLNDRMIVVGTGEIGLGQRFAAIVDASFADAQFQQLSPVDMVTNISHRALKNFQHTFVQPHDVPYGALLAFGAGGNPHLCEFQYQNMRPELKSKDLWYVSMGSGQMIVDPFLALMRAVFWESGPPTRQDGIFYVMCALRHAIDCNPGGINEPIQIAVLTVANGGQPHARLLSESELLEHRENVSEAVEHLRAYRSKLKGEQLGEIPTVPTPNP